MKEHIPLNPEINEFGAGRNDTRPIKMTLDINPEDLPGGDDETLEKSFKEKDAKNRNEYFFTLDELPDENPVDDLDLKATVEVWKEKLLKGNAVISEKELAELDEDEREAILPLIEYNESVKELRKRFPGGGVIHLTPAEFKSMDEKTQNIIKKLNERRITSQIAKREKEKERQY